MRGATAPTEGNDTERPSALDAIRLEVVVIDGEDRGQRFPLGETNQRRIRKVHRPIRVALHKPFEVRNVYIGDWQDRHGPGPQEPPGLLEIPRARPEKMKQLGEHGGRGSERQSQGIERLGAALMPFVVVVEQRQKRARINQPGGAHASARLSP